MCNSKPDKHRHLLGKPARLFHLSFSVPTKQNKKNIKVFISGILFMISCVSESGMIFEREKTSTNLNVMD